MVDEDDDGWFDGWMDGASCTVLFVDCGSFCRSVSTLLVSWSFLNILSVLKFHPIGTFASYDIMEIMDCSLYSFPDSFQYQKIKKFDDGALSSPSVVTPGHTWSPLVHHWSMTDSSFILYWSTAGHQGSATGHNWLITGLLLVSYRSPLAHHWSTIGHHWSTPGHLWLITGPLLVSCWSPLFNCWSPLVHCWSSSDHHWSTTGHCWSTTGTPLVHYCSSLAHHCWDQ